MKLVRSMTLALGVAALGFAGWGAGCGGTTVGTNAGSGGNGGSSGTKGSGGTKGMGTPDAGPGITPPTPPPGPKTTGNMPQNFAIHQLYLGDTAYGATGTQIGQDKNAWATMGYNIDGKITTATSTNVCKPFAATTSQQVDGNGGIDNSFGANLYDTLLTGFDQMASSTILTDINEGAFTLMFDVSGLSSDPNQTATGLSAQAFAGGAFSTTGAMPTWTPADNWPILGGSGLLTNSTPPFKSTIQFANAYVVNGTWVSGTPTQIQLALSISGISLNLSINHAVITFQHTSANHADKGVVSGVIETSALSNAIMQLAGNFGLCGGSSTLEQFIKDIKGYSDIMQDGSNNPGVTCDGISIGLGFEADVIGQPQEIEAPSCPKPSKCSDAAAPPCDAGPPPPPPDSGTKDSSSKG